MKEQKNNYIENLMAPLKQAKVSKESGWAAMERNVQKQNFRTFGFSHFNVFYIVAIATIITGTATFLYLNNTQESNVKEIEHYENIQNITTDKNNNLELPTPETLAVPNNELNEINTVKQESLQYKTVNSEPQKQKKELGIDRTVIKNETNDIQDNSTIHMQQQLEEVKNTFSEVDNAEKETPIQMENVDNKVDQKPLKSNKTFVIEETYDTIIKIDTQYVEKKGLFRR